MRRETVYARLAIVLLAFPAFTLVFYILAKLPVAIVAVMLADRFLAHPTLYLGLIRAAALAPALVVSFLICRRLWPRP